MDVGATMSGADQFKRDLADMAGRADNLEPFWESLSPMWTDRQRAVFTSGRLAPLSPRSVRRKRRFKNAPMMDTGKLRIATYRHAPVKSTADRATFGIAKGDPRKPIGAMHATKSGSRPKRDVVPNWSKAERMKILELLDDWVKRGRR